MDPVVTAFLIAGFIVVLGFLGEEFFRKTGIPDAVFLLLLGLLLGPVFKVFEKASLREITPFFAALALIIILFDGGLNMDISKVVRKSPRATVLAVLSFLSSVLFTTIIYTFVWGQPWVGILLGCVIGGTSSIIVIPIAKRIEVSEETVTILSLESAVTDVLCTVSTFAVMGIIISGTVSLQAALLQVAIAFALGASVGFLFGLGWSVVLDAIRGRTNAYMLTLAILLLAYVAAENLGGSGAVAALLLGLVLGNSFSVMRILRLRTVVPLNEDVRTFHGEISFLIRSFFFVFTGLLFKMDLQNLASLGSILFGIVASFAFLAFRVVNVRISTVKMLDKSDRGKMTVMLPRGLAAAVLGSLLVTNQDLIGAYPAIESFPEIAFTIILSTVIMCTVGVAILKRR